MHPWMIRTVARLSAVTSRLGAALGIGAPQPAFSDEPEEPVEDPLNSAAQQLMEELSAHRDEAVTVLAHASELTERHVVAIGEGVGAIVVEIQGYVEEVRDTLAGFEDHGSQGSVAGAISNQEQEIAQYLIGLGEDCQRQAAVTSQAIELCGRISSAAARVNRLTGASKLLSLNTSIHANRLGGNGRALGVIAHEMQLTSERVREINEKIGGTADQLVQAIQKTVAQSEHLREMASQLNEEIAALSREISAGSDAVEARVREASQLSDQRLGALLQQSMAALSHLQFQDPMIQSLQQLDPLLADGQTAIARALGLPDTYAALRYLTNLGLHLDTAQPAPSEDLDDMLFFE